MSFQLSPDADNTKIFLVNLSEVGGRLDPNFIKKSRLLKSILANSQFSFQGFGNYIKNIQYGISQLANTEQKGVPIIRMNNLQGDEWNFLDLKHIELTGKELNLYRVNKGDLLFNRTNSKELVGKCGVFREEGDWGFASYLIRVQIDEKKLLPDFASTFLRLPVGRLQIDGLSRQIIGMTNINAEEIKLLQIPIVPLDFQKQVVSRMDAAYDAKKQKEEEAQRLLDSIDDYLLSELGINLSEPEENTIQNRIFYRNLNEITGDRIDPYPYQNKFKYFEQVLKSMPIEVKKLKDIVSFFDYGLMPTQDYAFSEIDGLPMIRVTNIKSDGSVDMSDTKYIKFDTPRLYQKLVKANDILMVQCGNTTGKCAFVTEEYEGYTFGSFSFAIRGNSNFVVQSYLFNILSSVVVQEQLNRSLTTASVRPNTSKPDVLNFKIPLPCLQKQQEIANNITAIRTQAKQLRQAAAAELEQAKQEVEAMILGERGNKA